MLAFTFFRKVSTRSAVTLADELLSSANKAAKAFNVSEFSGSKRILFNSTLRPGENPNQTINERDYREATKNKYVMSEDDIKRNAEELEKIRNIGLWY
jgi:hypothetical protein